MKDDGVTLRDLEVRDRERVITFRGRRIGSATTDESGRRPNWTTIDIYRTEAGNYIIHIVGRTRVAGETDRHTAHVSTTAAGAVESLYQEDEDGVIYLTRVARAAAIDAAARDAEFSEAYYAQHVA